MLKADNGTQGRTPDSSGRSHLVVVVVVVGPIVLVPPYPKGSLLHLAGQERELFQTAATMEAPRTTTATPQSVLESPLSLSLSRSSAASHRHEHHHQHR